MPVGAGRPLCLFGSRQQGKSGLVFFRVFELRLYLGKEGDTGVVGHVWNYSGGINDIFLSKRRVQLTAVFIYIEKVSRQKRTGKSY